MVNGSSIREDKAARYAGRVNRSSDSPESSSSTSQPPPISSSAEAAAVVASSSSRRRSGDGGGTGGDDYSTPTSKPPPYSGPATNPPQRPTQQQRLPGTGNGPQYYPGLPVLDYRQYSPPLFELSSDKTTLVGKAPYLSEDPAALAALIRNIATVPPKPYIFVEGKRGRKIDFAIKMNLMQLLVPDDPGRRMDYLRCVASDEMAYRGGQQQTLKPDLGADAGLEAWCELFVRHPATIKTFTVERVVANLDTHWLEGQLRTLVASLHYKGEVTVQFPIAHAKVVVHKPDKVNKFFTSVTSLFAGKNKYEVVKVVWPFATGPNGERDRQCLVQSEKTWWAEWKDVIGYAIATKRHGWVTNEDKLECIMEDVGRETPAIDWGPEYEY